MAAAVRTRNSYSPVSVEDTGQERLVRAESRTSVTKPRRGLSVWTFSLLVIGLCVLFLLGFCLGFYVRESQSSVEDILAKCTEGQQDGEKQTPLTAIHEDIMYRVRGEDIRQFMQDLQEYEDPVTGSLVERKLEQRVRQLLQDYMLDDLEIEEHAVPVSYADPDRPNTLQVLRKDDNTVINVTLKNDVAVSSDANSDVKSTSHSTTDDWKYPFVVHSPPGIVEGGLVYGHYGSEADVLILQAKKVSLKNRIVLLRLGKVSLAEKVQNVALGGASGVVVYWDPEDARDNPAFPENSSVIPYASAAVYTTESSRPLVPTIPVQTVSTETAAMLLRHLGEEEGVLKVPLVWTGGLDLNYTIGRKSNNGNLTVRLSVFNKEKKEIIRNIICNIHGTVERDRYIVIGAPRASLPGVSQDALTSTAILLQIARSIHTIHDLKQWKPRRGIKLVSWGGADIGNMGMLWHIKTHHHLLAQRAVAYFDVGQLVMGKEVVAARVSPGLYQVVNEVTMAVPDPSRPEVSIQSAWQDYYEAGVVSDRVVVPLTSYHSDRSTTPFLHVLGVTTVSLQYKDSQTGVSGLRVSDMTVYESQHHYKYHAAVARTLVQIMLSMVDDDIIPYSLTGATQELTNTLWQTSQLLQSCSKSMQDLDNVVKLSRELQQTAEVFDELIKMYAERQYEQGFRMVNDVKMLFERLWVSHTKGVPHHLLYPTDRDGSISRVSDLCEAGDIAEVWDATEELGLTLHTILTEAVAALRTTN